jgi:PAS domain S-box-containing protein
MTKKLFSSSLVASAIESIPEYFFFLDKNWQIILINKKGAHFLGSTKAELLGKDLRKLEGNFKRSLTFRKIQEAKKAGKAIEYIDFDPISANWSRVKISPSEHGVGFYSIDITESRITEDRFSIEQERLLLAQKAANIGTFEWDIKTNEVKWTPELEVLYGLESGGFKGKLSSWLTFIHYDYREKVVQSLELAVSKGQEFSGEFRVVWPDHSIHWIYAKGIPLHQRGKVDKMIGINMDITDRKEAERQKDEFISIASHELKTPVTTIKGLAQILQMQFGADKKLGYFLGKMEGQIDRLTNLINDLLDVSRIQSGKLTLHKEKTKIDYLIKEIIEDMQQTIAKHKIIFRGGASKTVEIDKYRLGQVLINLISNAVKYSPRADKIIVRSKLRDGSVEIEVEDFGIGVNKRDQKRIFEPFFQARNTIRQSHAGLGLGLHIAAEIVQKHGGSITVESTKGEGSTFSFTIPLNHKTMQKMSKKGGYESLSL